MYPFEWCLPKIPYLVANDSNDTSDMFEVLTGVHMVILGVHKNNWELVNQKLLECE